MSSKKEAVLRPRPVPITIICSGCQEAMGVRSGANIDGGMFVTVIPCTCETPDRTPVRHATDASSDGLIDLDLVTPCGRLSVDGGHDAGAAVISIATATDVESVSLEFSDLARIHAALGAHISGMAVLAMKRVKEIEDDALEALRAKVVA